MTGIREDGWSTSYDMMLLLVPVVLLLQCCSSETQERAPLYVFEAEQDVNETYGATSGIATV